MSVYAIAAIPVLIWVYLLTGRGGFWRVTAHCTPLLPPVALRKVVVLIPARNEASLVGAAVTSLAQQAFNGFIHLIVVDDGSSDGTADAAAAAARATGALPRLTVIRGAPLPCGWTGKLWALSQGLTAAAEHSPDYLLFTDADVYHGRDSVASLVATAEAHDRDLVSHMVKLSTATLAERLLIPAFVFFFFKLYPPAWIAAPRCKLAAAAGGCTLVRPKALARIGGLQAIRSHIIDDCALARAVKDSGGRIWLELTRDSRSLRAYGSSAEIGAMISRTAFAQLGHSYLVLTATLLGLFFTYLLPAVLLFVGDPLLVCLGAAALLLMSLCYLPMVRFYDLSRLWCVFAADCCLLSWRRDPFRRAIHAREWGQVEGSHTGCVSTGCSGSLWPHNAECLVRQAFVSHALRLFSCAVIGGAVNYGQAPRPGSCKRGSSSHESHLQSMVSGA